MQVLVNSRAQLMSMLRRAWLGRWPLAIGAVVGATAVAWPLFVAEAAAPGTPDILRDKRWLLVLSHLDDKVEGADDATYRDAVRAFQASQGLPKTGKLTTAHRQLLAERAQMAEARAGYKWLICDRTGIELRIPVKLAPQTQSGPQGRQWASSDGRFKIETFKFPAHERVASLRQRFAPGRSVWQDADDAEVSVETQNGPNYTLFKAYKGAREIRAVRVTFDVGQKDRFNAAMNVVGDSITPFPAPVAMPPLAKSLLPKPRVAELPKVASATAAKSATSKVEPAIVAAPQPVAPKPPVAPSAVAPEAKVSGLIKLNPPPQETAPVPPPAVSAVPATPAGPRVRFGTGFIINKSGQVITTEQTVRGCLVINVRSSGASGPVRVRYTDPANDLAILEVSGLKDRVPLALARSDTTRASVEPVVVLGYGQPDPPGSGGGLTATQGTIQAVKVNDNTPARSAGASLPVQFSSALKSGHSGGPMLDQFGRVVGVATSDSGRSKLPVTAVNLETLVGFLKTANVPFTAAAASWVVRGDIVVEEAKAAVVQISCEVPAPAGK
jgi:S1-C subfamily serine protease